MKEPYDVIAVKKSYINYGELSSKEAEIGKNFYLHNAIHCVLDIFLP